MYEFKSKDVFDFAEFIGAETKQKGNELLFKYCPRCHGGGGHKGAAGYVTDKISFKKEEKNV